MSKCASATSIISGSDGPTSVAIIKRNAKLTFKQKFQKMLYNIKRAYVEKIIKADAHTLDEVMEYIVTKYGFTEVHSDEVNLEYNEMRASFLMQYAPELMGEYATIPQLKSESREDIEAHIAQFRERQQMAMNIPVSEFDIDFHKFELLSDDINDNMNIIVEKRFAYIGGGASGSKKAINRFNRIFKDVYRYYGVTREDIENKSKRYEEVIRTLAR